ncbi:MAG: winged helix-turn-helix transcriptional regulator [Methanocorpusculum sp.]|nr:winged helix-turn-helix transcriptional regulator [Methanocorpusculum sp.]
MQIIKYLSLFLVLTLFFSSNAYGLDDGIYTADIYSLKNHDVNIKNLDLDDEIKDYFTPIEDNEKHNLDFLKRDTVFTFYNLFTDTPFRDFARSFTPILFALLGLFGFFFVLRFASKERKSSKVPGEIMEYLSKHPGSSQAQIVEALGKSRGSVAHHIKKLLNERHIYTDSTFAHQRYYVQMLKKTSPKDKLNALMSNRKCREVISILIRNQGLTRKEIADEMNMKPIAVFRYIKILIEGGILIDVRDGHKLRYLIKEEIKDDIAEIVMRENQGEEMVFRDGQK